MPVDKCRICLLVTKMTKNKSRKTGYENLCKTCKAGYSKLYRRSEKGKARTKERNSTAERRAANSRNSLTYKRKHPERVKEVLSNYGRWTVIVTTDDGVTSKHGPYKTLKDAVERHLPGERNTRVLNKISVGVYTHTDKASGVVLHLASHKAVERMKQSVTWGY